MSGLCGIPMIPTMLLTTLLLALSPQAAQPAHETSRPKYQFLRQNEDWSMYGSSVDLTETGDLSDRIKYIRLSDDGAVWLSFGGHFRARYENWNNFNFGLNPGFSHDDDFLLTRFLLHTDLHLGSHDRIFAEGKTAQSTDRDLVGMARPLDVDSLDLQQLFWDHSLSAFGGDATLRLGRQMLLLGRQRLVSPLPWGNTLRSWDGASVFWKNDDLNVQAFWTVFDPVDIGDFNEPDTDQDFYGFYGTYKAAEGCLFDFYLLGLGREMAAFNGTAGEESRYTLGGRANGKISDDLSYDVEAAYQFGEVGTGDVNAYMVTGELAYSLAGIATDPRLRLAVDVASGDKDPGGDVETFNQLFPLGHAYLGFIDQVGRQNIIDLSLGGDLTFSKGWKGRIDFHQFWLMSEDDALYNAGGGVVVPGGTSTSTSVGTEIDITTSYRIGRHTVVAGGVGRFFEIGRAHV